MHPRNPAQKWDGKFSKANQPGEPAVVLSENLHLLPNSGKALDLACGLGANALLLAERGLTTTAWDYSSVALNKLTAFASAAGLNINCEPINLESKQLPAQQFDVVAVSHYLYRPLIPHIIAALKPGGILFYQTFTKNKVGTGGPSNPKFLLEPNELLQVFSSLQTLYYREDDRSGNVNLGRRNLAYYIGMLSS